MAKIGQEKTGRSMFSTMLSGAGIHAVLPVAAAAATLASVQGALLSLSVSCQRYDLAMAKCVALTRPHE